MIFDNIYFLIVFGVVYVLYAIFYLKTARKVFKYNFPAFRNCSEEDKNKYFFLSRPEVNKINPFSMIICGLTLGFFRLLLWGLHLLLMWIVLKFVWCCSDTNRPLGCFRRFLAKWITIYCNRVELFCMGYMWLTTKKKHIRDYDPDYPK